MLRASLKSLSVAFVLMATAPGLSRADDTDVYVDNSATPPPSSQPLVMFSVDYRANLGSTICSDARNYTACPQSVFFKDEGLEEHLPATGPLTFFDIIRLSLRVVLRETSGYKAGLMLNHDQSAGQSCVGLTNSKCSNGGYIARRFRSINSVVADGVPDTDASRVELLAILDALPSTAGNLNHPFQGTELFYEFFRYLTGQRVFNSQNGWRDYGTDDTLNLCRRDFDTNTNSFVCAAGTDDNHAGRDNLAATGGSTSERIYTSPLIEADACTKIFTINFLFQVSQNDNDSNGAIDDGRSQGGLGINIPSNNSFQTVIGFLNDVDLAPETDKFNSSLSFTFDDGAGGTTTLGYLPGKQNVTSFFIARPTPEPGPNQPDPDVFSFDLTTEQYAKLGGTERPLPLSRDPAKLVAAIRNALQQILSVSTTFVAASVPVNVFNRAEIVDNVYFALFQARNGPHWDGNLKKFKLVARTVSGGSQRAEIVDVSGNAAISQTDGRILPDALSFWTDITGTKLDTGDTNGDGVVDAKDSNDADLLPDNLDSDNNVTFPTPNTGTAANPPLMMTRKDGRFVARGGGGQKIPGFVAGTSGPGDTSPDEATAVTLNGPRKLYYLSMGAASASLQPLNASLSTAEIKAQLGDTGLSNADATAILRYARGQDVNDADGDNNRSEARYWILGDPLHSRPLPLNYGLILGHTSQSKPAIFLAMASNDGALRMFRNTGAGDATTSAELGQEVWAFMPPEGLAIQRRLMNNIAGEPRHPYSFDGEPTALLIDQNGDGNIDAGAGDRVILYIGLRRGESRYNALNPSSPLPAPVSAYYALDVTNPLQPRFLWRITPVDRATSAGVAATSDFAEMGLTFSRPRVGSVQIGTNPDGSAIRRLAVFFGGGYHGGYAYNADGTVQISNGEAVRVGKDRDGVLGDDSRGNALYVVRADSSALIWKAVRSGTPGAKVFVHPQLRDGIASNVTIVDSNADGAHDRIYVGDTGGNLWRADLGVDNNNDNIATDQWTFTRIACLGRHGGTDCADVSSVANDRRFFHEPDVVQSSDGNGRYDAVIIGSGDRENPLDQGPMVVNSEGQAIKTRIDVDNWFYVIKDRNVEVGSSVDTPRDHAELTDVTSACISSPCTVSGEGWRLALQQPNGEKALSAPITIGGTIFFTTYLPPPPPSGSGPALTCGPKEGNGFLYAISLDDGSPTYNYDHDGGNEGDKGTTDADRMKDLNTPGIPAQVVFLGSPSALPGGTAGTGVCELNVMAGARIFSAPGCPRFKTFWQRVGG